MQFKIVIKQIFAKLKHKFLRIANVNFTTCIGFVALLKNRLIELHPQDYYKEMAECLLLLVFQLIFINDCRQKIILGLASVAFMICKGGRLCFAGYITFGLAFFAVGLLFPLFCCFRLTQLSHINLKPNI